MKTRTLTLGLDASAFNEGMRTLTLGLDASAFNEGMRKVTLGLDASAFNEGMRKVREAARGFSSELSRFSAELRRSEFFAESARRRCGAHNFAEDGAWQSDLCAAWLHGECPLPASCDCGCHR